MSLDLSVLGLFSYVLLFTLLFVGQLVELYQGVMYGKVLSYKLRADYHELTTIRKDLQDACGELPSVISLGILSLMFILMSLLHATLFWIRNPYRNIKDSYFSLKMDFVEPKEITNE